MATIWLSHEQSILPRESVFLGWRDRFTIRDIINAMHLGWGCDWRVVATKKIWDRYELNYQWLYEATIGMD